MKIPKSFNLLHKKYTVDYDDDLVKSKDADGNISYSRCLITLQGNYNECEYDNEVHADTFCHEVVHAILHEMGEYELNEGERFVDGFSKILNQFLETMEH